MACSNTATSISWKLAETSANRVYGTRSGGSHEKLRSSLCAMRRECSPLVRQRPLRLCSIALLLVLSACGPHARYDLLLYIVSCCLVQTYCTGNFLLGTPWTELLLALFPRLC